MSRPNLLRAPIEGMHVLLVEVSHAILDDPIRVVVDNADLDALGKTWVAGYLSFRLPNEIDGPRSAQITVQNVDWRIGTGVRQMITPAVVKFTVVDRSDPETIISDFPPMYVAGAEGDEARVSGTLTSILNPMNPARNARCTKDSTPAAYR